MSVHLSPHLRSLTLHPPQVAGNVAIVQLTGTDPNFPPLTPYHVAHAQGLVEITERGGANAVSEISARNKSDRLILILEGEVLIGAKQNRTVNVSVLLPPKSTTIIPVSCVERGRWSGMSDFFSPSETFVTPDMREKKIRSGLEAMDACGTFRPDQGEVWSEVSNRMAFLRVMSDSDDFSSMGSAKKDDIKDVAHNFPRRPGSVGIVGFIGGRIVGCDIVPEPGIFAGYYDRLVKSYALDSLYLKNPEPADVDYPEKSAGFILKLGDAETESYSSPGAGSSVRLRDESLSGAALVYDKSMIHLGAFSTRRKVHTV